jgi:2-polyprenyl-3-methyl-5-hydroxy-6-metoxy-1,4-benzoquinol methylase
MNYKAIDRCRISGSKNLIPVLDLGVQALTGVFPDSSSTEVTSGPLRLVWCADSGLLQLEHSYDLSEMYGDNYGYRSGLNASMVEHLRSKVKSLHQYVDLKLGDHVLDIGSNDGTLLSNYKMEGLRCFGIDPTASKFASYYDPSITVVPDFFDKSVWNKVSNGKSAKIVTSIAMFYDLESPAAFVRDIRDILAKDGIWHFEQSYMPAMLRTNSYDTICHEHLEFYSLTVINNLLKKEGLRIIDVSFNSINGGSFSVTAAHKDSSFTGNDKVIDWMLGQEERMQLHTPSPYRQFEERVFNHREDLRRLVDALLSDGKKIAGYGASTKGNVLLQFCGFTEEHICAIAEINDDKFGKVTPGSNIPIKSETEVREMKPDYMLVLPWHFRDSIIRREKEYLANGGSLIFPFPEIEII